MSRFPSLLVAAVVALGAARADAQACCAGASVFAPARLKLDEDALAGMQLRARTVTGSLGSDGAYVPAPQDTHELDFEQDALGLVRLWQDLQLGVVVPLVETHRSVPGLSESGWGLGDLGLTGRYEFVSPNTSPNLPGIALAVGATLPTGTAPERASKPLATDATGLGAAQLSTGVDLERAFGNVLVDASAIASYRFVRHVGTVTERLGLTGSVVGAVGYAFRHQRALALSAAYLGEGEALLNGQRVPDSGRRLTTLALAGATPIVEGWRVQARLYEDLPLLGKNQPSGPGFAATVVRTW